MIKVFLISVLLLVPTLGFSLELSLEETDNSIPITIMPISGKASGIIEADLKRSGRLKIISHSKITGLTPFGGSIAGINKFSDITDYIVRGKISKEGSLAIEVISTSDAAVTRFSIPANKRARRVAHQAADKIYQKITRIRGAFDTRIAYVVVTNKASPNRQFRLMISDSDGQNAQTILTSKEPVMSPEWSPNGRVLAYVSFEGGESAIYMQNIFSGEKVMVSGRRGINGAPAWSPDGKRMAMNLSIDGNSEIYTVNLESGQLTLVTKSDAIDTEPVWSGTNSIIFTSNRGGSPQLYQVPAGGGKARRLTFNDKYNSAADVANNKITFVTGQRGAFHIALKTLGSTDKVILSNGRLDESPSVSPNGAMVAYVTKKGNQNRLSVVSDNGRARQFLSAPAGDIREPAWSPYLR